MAGKNDNFDALMAMMALKHIMDEWNGVGGGNQQPHQRYYV